LEHCAWGEGSRRGNEIRRRLVEGGSLSGGGGATKTQSRGKKNSEEGISAQYGQRGQACTYAERLAGRGGSRPFTKIGVDSIHSGVQEKATVNSKQRTDLPERTVTAKQGKKTRDGGKARNSGPKLLLEVGKAGPQRKIDLGGGKKTGLPGGVLVEGTFDPGSF